MQVEEDSAFGDIPYLPYDMQMSVAQSAPIAQRPGPDCERMAERPVSDPSRMAQRPIIESARMADVPISDSARLALLAPAPGVPIQLPLMVLPPVVDLPTYGLWLALDAWDGQWWGSDNPGLHAHSSAVAAPAPRRAPFRGLRKFFAGCLGF